MDFVTRFLKYVGFETTSSEENANLEKASSEKEYALSNELKKEIVDLGGKDVKINKFGTVTGFFPGSIKRDPITLIAHIDTSPSASGKDIKPRIIDEYDGKDIKLSENIFMKVSDFPFLSKSRGHKLIVTDGKTLLGADDKAGIAIAMTLVDYFVTTKTPHAPIEVCFSTDEEIGQGAEHIDLKDLKSKFGYTLDGGDIDYFNIECFNAASMSLEINGRSVHPGSAKDKMINALNVGIDFHNSLPRYMRPEDTENREGFYHLLEVKGNEEKAQMAYIVRDHDINKLRMMEDYAKLAARRINDNYKAEVIKLSIKESYKNMKDEMDKHPEVMKLISDIYEKKGMKYEYEPIRGGTDGANLTLRGFPCPNLGTGGYNYHGRFEYEDVNQALKMIDVLKDLFN
jgi:tripeptide aminopeptidase